MRCCDAMEGPHDDWSWPQALPGITFRRAALALAAVVGVTVGVTVVALLPTGDWAGILAVCAGSVAAAPSYALVTQLGDP